MFQKPYYVIKFLVTVCYLSFFLSFTSTSFSAEIDDIRLAIKEKNAKWTADITSVHKLDKNSRKMRVGLTFPSSTAASVPEQTHMAYPLTAPTGGFDWRDFNGTDYVTPIKDQGDCGSCWAFSTAGALESYTLIHGTYNPTLDLSEQVLISCSGAGSCNGGTIDGASSFIEQTGLPNNSLDPYTATNSSCPANSSWDISTDKVSLWEWISAGPPPSVATIKNAIYTFGPVVVTMNVYSDFYAYSSGVYTQTTGTYQGGHAIIAIGYADDATSPGGGYFIAKNSWGTGWGEPYGSSPGGYFRIGYSELTSVTQFANYAIAYDPSSPSCSYAISPTVNTMTGIAGTANIAVTAGSSCVWSPKSSVSWITLGSTAAVNGSGTISYSVTSNTTSSPRTGTITLTGNSSNIVATFTVTQQVKPVTYSISGSIHSASSTGSVIAGATVSFAGQTTTSASNGTFSITGVAAGTYALSVSMPGYSTYSSSVALSANKSVSIVMTPLTYSFSGIISSGISTGTALSGAKVTIAGKSTATLYDGTFSISNIPYGTYTYTVTKSGYMTYTSGSIDLNSNLSVTAYLIPVTYTVSGSVKSGSNYVSGATVTLNGITAVSSGNGSFSITGIPAGTYTLTVTAEGYTPYSASVSISASKTLAVSLTPMTYSLAGTVSSESSPETGLAGAKISVAGKSVTSNSAGIFSLSGITAGTYTITVSKTGYSTFTNNALNISFSQSVNILLNPIAAISSH